MKTLILSTLLLMTTGALAHDAELSYTDFPLDADGNLLYQELESAQPQAGAKNCLVAIRNKTPYEVDVKAVWKGGILVDIVPIPAYTCRTYSRACLTKSRLVFEHNMYPKGSGSEGWKKYTLRSSVSRHKSCEDARQYFLYKRGKNKIRFSYKKEG